MPDVAKSFKGGFHIPWFIFDKKNYQLITSKTIPLGDISDTKQVVLAESPIAGLNYNPVQYGGNGNRKISFTLPLVVKNGAVGNVALVKSMENFRNQSSGLLLGIFSKNVRFATNPKVIYHWGSGSGVPLEYFVAKCDFVHKSSFVNRFGYPQYSEVSFELILDESSKLYKAEETFRQMAALGGAIASVFQL